MLNENKEEIGLRENVDEDIDYVPEKEQELDEVDAFDLSSGEEEDVFGIGDESSMFGEASLFDDMGDGDDGDLFNSSDDDNE